MEDDEDDEDIVLPSISLLQDISHEARKGIGVHRNHSDRFEEVWRRWKARDEKLEAFEKSLENRAEPESKLAEGCVFHVEGEITSQEPSTVLKKAKMLLKTCEQRCKFSSAAAPGELKGGEAECCEDSNETDEVLLSIARKRVKLMEEFSSNELMRRIEMEVRKEHRDEDVAKELALIEEQKKAFQREIEVEQQKELEAIEKQGEKALELLEKQRAFEERFLLENDALLEAKVPEGRCKDFPRAVRSNTMLWCEDTNKVDENKSIIVGQPQGVGNKSRHTQDGEVPGRVKAKALAPALDRGESACMLVSRDIGCSRAELCSLLEKCIRHIEKFGMRSVIDRFPPGVHKVLENMHQVLVIQVNAGYDYGDHFFRELKSHGESQELPNAQKRVSRLVAKVFKLSLRTVSSSTGYTEKWKGLEQEAMKVGLHLALMHHAKSCFLVDNERPGQRSSRALFTAFQGGKGETVYTNLERTTDVALAEALETGFKLEEEPERETLIGLAASERSSLSTDEPALSAATEEVGAGASFFNVQGVEDFMVGQVVAASEVDAPGEPTVNSRLSEQKDEQVALLEEADEIVPSAKLVGTSDIKAGCSYQEEESIGSDMFLSDVDYGSSSDEYLEENIKTDRDNRGSSAGRDDPELLEVLERAATRIQALARGHLCRLHYFQLQAEQRALCCLSRFQAFWRGVQVRRQNYLDLLRTARKLEDFSALKIQAHWRGKRTRMKFRRALARSKYIDDDELDYSAIDDILFTAEETVIYNQDIQTEVNMVTCIAPTEQESPMLDIWRTKEDRVAIMDAGSAGPVTPSEALTSVELEDLPTITEWRTHAPAAATIRREAAMCSGTDEVVPPQTPTMNLVPSCNKREAEQKRKDQISSIARDWGFKNEKTVMQFLKACSKKRPSRKDEGNSLALQDSRKRRNSSKK